MKKTLIYSLIWILLCGPSYGANDFSGDATVQLLLTFEDYDTGQDATDTSGKGNTLDNQPFGGFPAQDLVNVKEGSIACKDLSTIGRFLLADGSLSADFPGKNGNTTLSWSCCFWAYPTDVTTTSVGFVTSKSSSSGRESWACNWTDPIGGANEPYWTLRHGYNGGASQQDLTHTAVIVGVNKWYHVGMTYAESDDGYRVRVWDEDATTVSETTGTTAGAMSPDTADFSVFAWGPGSFHFLGTVDEIVLWNRVLSAAEIDQVRQGTFGASSGAGGFMIISDNYWENFFQDLIDGTRSLQISKAA